MKKAIAKKQMSNTNFNPDKCIIQNNGNLKCFKGEESLGIVEIDMKGEIPYKGVFEIKNNKFKYKNIWLNGEKYYAIATLLDDADNNNNKISIGDKYSYKVNDTDTFNFYVLSFNEDNTVNLIMDRNICENGTTDYKNDINGNYCRCAWYEERARDGSKGPVTAIKYLYNGTRKWINVSNINLVYNNEGRTESDNSGYIGILINDGKGVIKNQDGTISEIELIDNFPLKARLPKESEAAGYSIGAAKAFLVDNLKYFNTIGYNGITIDKYYMNNSADVNQNISGYWLLASNRNHTNTARYLYYQGKVDYVDNPANKSFGVRPVITVPISDLE